MRNTKAKKLRRQAEKMTTGKSELAYTLHKKFGYTILHPDCTRAVYQNLKKSA